MELLTDTPLPLTLALLALLDGLSIGTLLIPVFLLLAPGRVRARRILLYLGTIAGFYLLVGVLFMIGLVNLIDVASGFLASPTGTVLRLIAGAALLLTGILMGSGSPKKAAVPAGATDADSPAPAGSPSSPAAPAAPGAIAERPGRLLRWRDRLMAADASTGAVMAVALAAGLAEVATMLPYLVAMGALAEASVPMPVRFAALAAYCLVMVAPALVLLVLRLVAARAVDAPLRRFATWMERTSRENTAWIVGIVGFLVARGAATDLGVFDWLARLGS